MDAAGVVPQELAADFKAYRARLQARLRRCAWTQQNARRRTARGRSAVRTRCSHTAAVTHATWTVIPRPSPGH
eukprot:11163626-Lingulodinium_polyedra.AAC.1